MVGGTDDFKKIWPTPGVPLVGKNPPKGTVISPTDPKLLAESEVKATDVSIKKVKELAAKEKDPVEKKRLDKYVNETLIPFREQNDIIARGIK